MMRARHVAIVLSASAPLLATYVTDAASETPRACLTKEREIPPIGLPDDNTVLVTKSPIDHANTNYWVATYSETAKSGRSRSEQCFRYEIQKIAA